MNFYKELSDFYEGVFPINSDKIKFIEEHASNEGLTLDIACGVGTDAIGLSKLQFQVEGLDLEKKMIEQARENAEKEDVKVTFKTCSMLDIKEFYEAQTISNILCTGNSLVHLDNMNEIESFLEASYALLKEGGTLIIQIINFDRVLDQKVKALPTIHNEDEKIDFIRQYEHDQQKGKINFATKLTAGGKNYNHTIPLFPLRKNELNDLLVELGFSKTNYYGNFKGEVYSPTSYATIVVAKK